MKPAGQSRFALYGRGFAFTLHGEAQKASGTLG